MQLKQLVWIAAVPLAALAAWHAALGYYRSFPAAAPPFLENDPGIALANDDLALLDGAGQQSPDRAQIEGEARAVLRERPLSAGALRQLALAEPAAGAQAFAARLALAEQVSRRDLGTQVSLFDAAAAAGDYAAAMDHLDTVLTVYPQAGSAVYPVLATVIGDKAFRQAVIGHATRPWFRGFVAAIISSADPLSAAAVVEEAELSFAGSDAAHLATLLTRLVKAGYYPKARQLVLRSPRGAATVGAFGFTRETSAGEFAPLAWRLSDSAAVRAQPGPNGSLAIEAQPGRHGLVAERVTGLSPGRYRLDQQVAGEEAGSRLGWNLACGGEDGASIWRQLVPVPTGAVRYRSRLTIPNGCAVQRWQLTVTTAEGQRPTNLQVAELELTPE